METELKFLTCSMRETHRMVFMQSVHWVSILVPDVKSIWTGMGIRPIHGLPVIRYSWARLIRFIVETSVRC